MLKTAVQSREPNLLLCFTFFRSRRWGLQTAAGTEGKKWVGLLVPWMFWFEPSHHLGSFSFYWFHQGRDSRRVSDVSSSVTDCGSEECSYTINSMTWLDAFLLIFPSFSGTVKKRHFIMAVCICFAEECMCVGLHLWEECLVWLCDPILGGFSFGLTAWKQSVLSSRSLLGERVNVMVSTWKNGCRTELDALFKVLQGCLHGTELQKYMFQWFCLFAEFCFLRLGCLSCRFSVRDVLWIVYMYTYCETRMYRTPQVLKHSST